MSLKRISSELGLSLTTVSRALNGYPEVASATRDVVFAAAKRLNYRPNANARRLALGRTDAIGLVYPISPTDLGDLPFLEVAASMSARLAQEKIDLLIISAASDNELETYQRAVAARRVDAFVLARTRIHDARFKLLDAEKVPFIAYGRSTTTQPYSWFDFDNYAGAQLAARRLLNFGHRRFGYIGAAAHYQFATHRYEGFKEALHTAGLNLPDSATVRTALDRRSGYAAMQNLLALPEPPTAVCIDNNLAGVGAVHALNNAGKVLGRDVSVVVYDGVGTDSIIRTPVTSIMQPTPERAGHIMADMLVARLRGAAPESQQILLPQVLEHGTSDGPAP